MKKLLTVTFVTVLAIMIVAPVAFAGGYGGGDGTRGKITFSGDHEASGHPEGKTTVDTTNVTPLSASGFTFTMDVIAVYDYDPGFAVTKVDETPWGTRWVVKPKDQPDLFEGATLYAFGTQSDWPAPRFDREAEFNTENVYGSASITGDRVSIHIKNKVPGEPRLCQPIVWFMKFADGSYAWGGHPNHPAGKWVAWNRQGKPQTAFCLDNDQGIVYPDKACQEMAAKRR